MDFSEIRYEQHDAITIITFNRPAVRNCIGPRTHRELVEAWGRFRDDEQALVAVLTGEGSGGAVHG